MQLNKKRLVYRKSDGGRLEVSHEAFLQMIEYRQISKDAKEAGGVLIGRYIIDSNDIVIDKASTPQSKDKRKRFRFFRNKNEHQVIINLEWNKSKGTFNYLGEWHTHPEPVPIPSIIDVHTWKRQVKQTTFEGDSLYFIIIGQKEIEVFEINKMERQLIRLNRLKG